MIQDVQNVIVLTNSQILAEPVPSISQEKYGQLVSLLQQENLIPSASNDVGYNSNQVTFPKMVHLGHSSNKPTSSSISNFSNFNSLLPCSTSNTNVSNCWLINFGANDHICSWLHSFDSFCRVRPVNFNLTNANSIQLSYVCNVKHFSLSIHKQCFIFK